MKVEMDQEPNVYLCINAFVHLCICVFVYNVDDTEDDILMIVEMALPSSAPCETLFLRTFRIPLQRR